MVKFTIEKHTGAFGGANFCIQIINNYEIAKIEDCKLWACIKVGQKRGLSFKTKRAAIGYAKSH